MRIVTGTMVTLKKKENCLNGTVRVIFQPAEELGNGAVKVVKTGIVDDLDYLFGVHVRPKNEIQYPACAAGIQHGACVFVKGKILGEDHHGARPHEGINAIEVGSLILQQLQQIHISPYIPASIKMTNFHAGTDSLNVIPGEASLY
ncbi:M20/M25/M40 family metallo-hydrolase [Pseudogracilibacillus sp. SO30301A]|uniref:M20/M25/M40 family metallo-hydrolase n=1 Tax=Pseudogracilibacillus sp. SO30301A TaxID=3098291 RepID=UPI00300DD7B4